MRKPRMKNEGEGFYHVTSRCVDRAFKFNDEDKTRIVDQIRRMGIFCGVEISTYTVMSNHFHLLLHVLPPRELDDDELLHRIAALYGKTKANDLRLDWEGWRRKGSASALKRLETARRFYLRRMGDLSIYMKELKQWISRAYNARHNRKGTLWEDRFWSSLLEDCPETLSSVAAYIDLNAVRAKVVARPEDYRWCGYAEAHAGREAARKALATLVHADGWDAAAERYGWLLRAVPDTPEGDIRSRLRKRIPALTRALAVGSQRFILETYVRFPKVFKTKRRHMNPFVTDEGAKDGALYASHRPREAMIG